jgi:hypothetical protein
MRVDHDLADTFLADPAIGLTNFAGSPQTAPKTPENPAFCLRTAAMRQEKPAKCCENRLQRQKWSGQ